MSSFVLRLVLVSFVVLSAQACRVSFPEESTFACANDGDCGGDGFVCAGAGRERRGVCCQPSGEEICDGLDNDCSGIADDLGETCYAGPEGTADIGVCKTGRRICEDNAPGSCGGEVLPSTELCNGADDDCDGEVDEGFDVLTDPANCGTCGNRCPLAQGCEAGTCRTRGELICDDGLDNDDDQDIDCADTDCADQSCGTGCVCRLGEKQEANCADGISNDGDADVDCADADCSELSCGAGCVCRTGARRETICDDGISNDGDAEVDCFDADCEGQSCGTGCTCVAGNRAESICDDGISNDGDALTDCADPDCNGLSCGDGCVCAAGNRTEDRCNDGISNDGDAQIDCLDPDCGAKLCASAPSTRTCAGTACSCNAMPSQAIETSCNDGVDNDCSGAADCMDAACDGQSCGTDCVCFMARKRETNCADRGIDNDNDGRADCLDTEDCPNGSACQYPQGGGGNWKNGTCQNRVCQ